MDRIKILIADDIAETRSVVRKLLSLESNFLVVGEAGDGEEVLRQIPIIKPDVVLMDINMPVLNGLEATERIANEFPEVIVIIMSVQAESEYLKKAMFYGAKEYIIKPFNYDALTETVKTTYEKYKNRQVKLEEGSENSKHARIISFFSSKGGVGKSVLALNTSIVLSKAENIKVLLIDMDLQFGDISMLVNLYDNKTILDAVEEGQLTSYENIKPLLYSYNVNLDMLFAPGKPEAAEYITKDSIEKIIVALRNKYDVIIIDCGINFSDSNLYILDNSDKIMFVSTMEIVSLKNTKLGIRVMQSLEYDRNKVKLVINRFNTNYGISKREVEEVFKDEIFAFIPDDEKTVINSINSGYPFCDSNKYYKLKIGKAIETMCKNLFV